MYLSSNLMELILVWGSVCVVGVWSLTGPNNVSIQSGQELTVQCAYNTAYKSYIKYWCKGDSWRHCDIVVSTTEKNNEVTNGRFFINDTFSIPSFSVTMADVKPADSDTYYCGVEKSAHDMMHKIIVHVLPGICNKTAEWTDVVEFPSNVTEIQENRVIEVSCQKQYEKKTFGLQCRKESREFLLFPEDERSSCVERCGKLNVSSWNITLCPDQEYYDPGEEVTVICPSGFEPNFHKVRCTKRNNTNVWNVTNISCLELFIDTMTVPSKWTTRCHKGSFLASPWIVVPVTILLTLVMVLVGKILYTRWKRPGNKYKWTMRSRTPELVSEV
ncbi:uncharacterized protein LOC142102504 isoform X2 [Mixophyes fleayi]|uniref:uncharacterized protein LOC142102504 isoform X2 n=1 Tax=Mixophyes fleayi TaxID=3061075 RepID=UPI003F4DB564